MINHMKIAIVSIGRAHLLKLAKYFDENTDTEVVFYTMMPKSRCRKFGYHGKVISLLFPIGVCEIIIRHLRWYDEYAKDSLRLKLLRLFDKMVARILRPCDVLIGLNGNAVFSSIAAKKRYDAITICDQGSSHILTQNAAHYTYSNTPVGEVSTQNMLRHYDVCDYLMTACDYVRKSDLDNGISSERILMNPYGVDIEMFRPEGSGFDSEKLYDVIMVGSWWKHKGCDILLKVCIEKLGLRLLHVGTVIDCELPDNPLFTHIDAVAEEDLPQYYRQARIFAMCSIDEGFGLVLLQAAACGLPVVASSRTGVSAMKRLLDDSDYCIEIPEPLNEDNVALSILRAMELYKANPLGLQETLRSSKENISWDAYGKRYYKILKQLLR